MKIKQTKSLIEEKDNRIQELEADKAELVRVLLRLYLNCPEGFVLPAAMEEARETILTYHD